MLDLARQIALPAQGRRRHALAVARRRDSRHPARRRRWSARGVGGPDARAWSPPTSSSCAAVPVLVVMFLGYYAFPALGYRVNAYVAVAVAQIVYVGAFVAEIVRSAIHSVPAGQIAAAHSLGMRRGHPAPCAPAPGHAHRHPAAAQQFADGHQADVVRFGRRRLGAHLRRARGRRTHPGLVPDFSGRDGDLLPDLLSAVVAGALVRGTLWSFTEAATDRPCR